MIYIGQHQTENIDDGYMGSGLRIKRAIEKYGIENFEKTILFECSSAEEMNAKEAEIVNEDFIARDDVYNIIVGGTGGWDYVNKEQLNTSGNWKNIAQQCKDIFNKTGHYPSKGQMARLKETDPLKYQKICNSISHGLKQKIQNESFWWIGRHHSEETKQKMKDFHAKNHPQAGEKNSQYGTIAIYNEETFERATQPKDQPILEGWVKGRFYSATPEELKERKKLVEEILKLDPNLKVSIRMKLQRLQRIHEKILNPNLHVENENTDLELKRFQREQQIREKTELLTKQYEFYNEYGWNEFVKKFDYQYSYPNFVQQCKKYVKNFIPQNGKKRGKK